MSVQIKALFTGALGLQPPWAIRAVWLDTAKHRIDFSAECRQKVHDWLTQSWRHLDFFQY